MWTIYKKQKESKNLKKQEIHNIFIKTKLDKSCFQHDIAYGDFKNLIRKTTSEKILRGKAFNIAKNWKYDGYQRGISSMHLNFLFCKLFLINNCQKNYTN